MSIVQSSKYLDKNKAEEKHHAHCCTDASETVVYVLFPYSALTTTTVAACFEDMHTSSQDQSMNKHFLDIDSPHINLLESISYD